MSIKALPSYALYGWDSTNETWVRVKVDANGNISITNTDLTTILSEIQNATYGLSALNDDLDSIISKVNVIDGYHDVPTADVTTNLVIRDVVGNKTDAAVTTVATTKTLMAYIKGILNEIEHGTYGLSAIETLVDETESLLKNGTYGLSALKTEIDANETKIDDLDSDLVTHNTALSTHDTDIKADIGDFSSQSNLQSLLAVLGIPDVSGKSLYTCLITDRLDDATNGLTAIKAEVEGIGGITPATQANVSTEVDEQIGNYAGQSNLTTLLVALGIPDVTGKPLYTCLITDRLDNATYGLNALDTDLGTLLTRLSATRAGYLDELDFGIAEYLEDLRQKATSPSWDQDTDSLEALSEAIAGVPTTTEAEGYVENAGDTAIAHDITTGNDTSETDVVEIQKTGIYTLSLYLDLATLVTAGEGGTVTVRLKNKLDGTNYRTICKVTFVVGTDEEHPNFEANMLHEYSKVTIQCSDDVTGTRAVAGRYIVRDLGS